MKSKKQKFKLFAVVVFVLAATLLFFHQPLDHLESSGDAKTLFCNAEIGQFVEQNQEEKIYKAKMIDCPHKEGEVEVLHSAYVLNADYEAGDLVSVAIMDPSHDSFEIVEHVRYQSLYWLLAIFVVFVLVLARWHGFRALLGMLFSFLVLFKLVLPQLILGAEPIFTVMVGAALIIPGTFFLTHGFNRKTSIAVIGTLLALLVTGFLAAFFIKFTHLTGLASEETLFLQTEDLGKTLNFQGLLLAGVLISMLGVLDDVTISQVSIVDQLRAAKKSIGVNELYSRAISVGRDHMASIVNTLVLVYTGASLPLLMLFVMGDQTFLEVLNYELVAQEVVQTLIASIGVVLAIPITTVLACFKRK